MLRWYSCDSVSEESLPDSCSCRRLHFAVPAFEVFRDAVYAAHGDECCAGIHRPNDFAQVRCQEVCSLGLPVPDDKDGHVSGECACLQDQGNLDQDLTGHVLSGTICGVCRFGCAVGDHQLDEEVDADEGCQYTSRM